MSRDLLFGTISGSVARDDADEGRLIPGDASLKHRLLVPTLVGSAAAAAAAIVLFGGLQKAGRGVERTYYKTTWRDLNKTQETPAVSMRELVYGRRGGRG